MIDYNWIVLCLEAYCRCISVRIIRVCWKHKQTTLLPAACSFILCKFSGIDDITNHLLHHNHQSSKTLWSRPPKAPKLKMFVVRSCLVIYKEHNMFHTLWKTSYFILPCQWNSIKNKNYIWKPSRIISWK